MNDCPTAYLGDATKNSDSLNSEDFQAVSMTSGLLRCIDSSPLCPAASPPPAPRPRVKPSSSLPSEPTAQDPAWPSPSEDRRSGYLVRGVPGRAVGCYRAGKAPASVCSSPEAVNIQVLRGSPAAEPGLGRMPVGTSAPSFANHWHCTTVFRFSSGLGIL